MPNFDDYQRLVNGKWLALQREGKLPTPSEQEAVTGAKRLYRKAMGKPWRGAVKITSGHRHTWIRRGTLHVNPGRQSHRAGWPDIVHGISHWAHWRLNPQDRPHSEAQLRLERDLTDYAINSGFHLGLLKTKKRGRKEKDVIKKRYQRILAREKSWRAKLKRAENALAKVQKEQRQYEQRHGERLA